MKKFLAVIMSLVMMFSLAALPVAAAEETPEPDEVTISLGDVFDTLELTVELIEDTVNKIHYIVGTILGMLDKECPLCAQVHEIVVEEEDESVEDEIPEDVKELLSAF